MNEELEMRKEELEKSEEQRYKEENARLEIISKSIKGIAAMSQVGITYCIVIPGHGVREDCRLGSNFIAPPEERSISSIINEVNGNIVGILETYMNTIRKMEYPNEVAEGLIDSIVKTAKQRFEESWAGVGQGAGPQ